MRCLLDQLYRETRDSELLDDMVHLHLQEASTYQDNVQDTIVIETPKIKLNRVEKSNRLHRCHPL